MKRLVGGDAAEPGFYWSGGRWEIVTVAAGGHRLEGGPADSYVKLPAAAALALAPLMGGAFAMFLPFIGFVMVFRELGVRMVRAVWRGSVA